jgi:hypothetical protein
MRAGLFDLNWIPISLDQCVLIDDYDKRYGHKVVAVGKICNTSDAYLMLCLGCYSFQS